MIAKTPDRIEAATRQPMSYEAYLAEAWDNRRAEWVEGEVIVHMPPRYEHQSVAAFLLRLLAEYAALFDLGVVQGAPFEVRLWPGGPSREPDLFFLRKENLGRLIATRLEGPPDLVVEVISPDSVRRDRQEKHREYARAGVGEYWIIDPRPGRRRADFYRLDAGGQYELVATEDDETVVSTALPGFVLRTAWMWVDPQPDVISLLYAMSPETAAAIRARLGF